MFPFLNLKFRETLQIWLAAWVLLVLLRAIPPWDIQGACQQAVLLERFSPDMLQRAVVFERTCHARTPLNTRSLHLSILPSQDPLPALPGNVLSLPVVQDSTPKSLSQPDVQHHGLRSIMDFEWRGNAALWVAYPEHLLQVDKDGRTQGVSIQYEILKDSKI